MTKQRRQHEWVGESAAMSVGQAVLLRKREAVKLSISLSEDDVAALDRFAAAAGLASRSAAVQHASKLLGDPELTDAYTAAWDEWEASGDAADWDTTLGDGLLDASR